MTVSEYITEIETLVEDNGIVISPKSIERLAKRASEIELDGHFSAEETTEELFDTLPKKYQDDPDISDLVEQISDLVVAEASDYGIVEDED